MGLMEKYVKWKKGEIFNITGSEKYIIELFKSGINEEQVMILEKYEKYTTIVFLIGLLLYFLIGLVLGFLLFLEI